MENPDLRSDVWNYCTRSEDKTFATCNLCQQVLKTKDSSTIGPSRHLERVHKIKTRKIGATNILSTIWNVYEVVSRLAAQDGFTFYGIANSKTIRDLYEEVTGGLLPTSPNSIREYVLKYFGIAKRDVISAFESLKSKGQKFSITADEWTSSARHRYLNVNVHMQNDFWNLGLIRIKGSADSERLKQLCEERLEQFGLSLQNVFAIVCDGAMQKFARISKRQSQLCFAHAIHLAVSDVMYQKKRQEIIESEDEASETSESWGIELENTSQLDSELSIEEEMHSSFSNAAEEEIVYEPTYEEVINKVRSIIKMFNASPVKYDKLEKWVRVDSTTQGYKLVPDLPTRWNSMMNMLRGFLKLKEAIKNALIDLGMSSEICEQDFVIMNDIVRALYPIELAAESICRRDATLITADASFTFMLDELKACDSELGNRLFEAVHRRIVQRRTDVSEVASYLNYGSSDDVPGHAEGYFQRISQKDLIKTIKIMYEDNVAIDSFEPSILSEENTEASESLFLDVSLESRLSIAINRARSHKIIGGNERQPRDLTRIIKTEMATFESTGRKGKILDFVHKAILTVPPSSVEAERVFSSANNICRKTRARLGDQSIDALCFLKSYLSKKKKK